MTTTHQPAIGNYAKKQVMAVIAVLFLIPALWIIGIWIDVWNSHRDMTSSARVSHFLDHFPSFMNQLLIPAVITIACCVISLTLAAKSFKQRSVFLRVVTMLTAMLAALIIILTVFMMLF